ncbi:MAG: hypothetical protein PUK12_06120 [Clostridiales bacterium]|nr:hypothetical protein [Clostridiales bacterium]MDY5725891.1 hypothetical protein [Eubacteriales bacterium]
MKKLIPAICMTLIAAVMLASSTFAWFSMNTQVTATGMQVVAKSDNTYLLISSTNSMADQIQTENVRTTALTVSDADAKVYPCAPVTSDTEVGYLTTSGIKVGGGNITVEGVKVTNATTAAAVTNWYTANAASSSASTINAGTARQLTDFTGYVIQKTVYLTVAKGANAANNLKVTPTIELKSGNSEKTVDAVRVLITTSDDGFKILKKDSGAVGIEGSNTNLTDSTVLTVKIYIYIDGNDSTVFTNNAVKLDMATISLLFSVDAVPAA